MPPDVQVDRNVVNVFIGKHCVTCHGTADAESGLRLDTLSNDLSEPAAFEKWVLIHDRLAAGTMPPKDADPLSDADRRRFADHLNNVLTTAHQQVRGTVLRRLNRREYQNTMNDLFGTNLKLADMFPEDGRSGEFDNVGSALSISLVQMQRYLEAARLVLDTSIASATEKQSRTIVRAGYADTRGAENFLGKQWLKLDDGAVVFYSRFGYPTGMLREANVSQPGFYKVRVTGYAHQSDQPITFSIGATTFARGAEEPTFGYFSMPPGDPTTVEVTAWIEARYMIRVEPWGISDRYLIKRDGIENYRGPGLAIQHIEVEGPLIDEFPSRGHHLVFDGIDRREVEPRNPADKLKSWYKPKFEVHSVDPAGDAEASLQRIAAAAFRRPVSADEMKPYTDLFRQQSESGADFEESLKTAVSAVLASPEFLFLKESSGRLSDHQLAARLSYFLVRSCPDAELLEAAEHGRLTTDETALQEQAERLLNDPRRERFLVDLTDAWLNLRDMDFTVPDRLLFPEFDSFLKDSMIVETRSFLAELIQQDLPITNIVRSDFAMLNNRLAEHYGIEGVDGPEIRRTDLPADSLRGGFLSQASVMKVSANGTNTSPVVRGVWVMERILDRTPPPPPAGVPGVEPDIRGASTLRELLDKHRDVDSCRGCHQIIDPPGFALECFNPIGGFRDRYRSLGDGDPVGLEINGNRVRYKLGPPVDASGEMPDGRSFTGFQDFRRLLADDPDTLCRAFAAKLLTFASGRELGFSDRPEIDRIVTQTRSRNYGIRTLLYEVVSSEIFRSK
ncbi:MAG: DUF1592 domain-containing protein [Planctomycetaceae bacterium]|nr:DUF1592 domain-containing protein [Planctomycetaceae bacterium]